MAAGGVSSRTLAKFSFALDVRRLANGWSVSAAIPWLILILGLIAYHQVYTVYRFDTPVHGDGEGYYAYIPAYLLHGDPSFSTLIRDHIIPMYASLGHQPPSQFGLTLQATGNWLDRYGIGVAVLLLPFFAIGHLIAVVGGSTPDGYSLPETFAAGTAAIVYTTAGLLILRPVLRRWFPGWAIAVTLVAIVFGTSLFDFTTWDSVTSHAFSFFAVSLALLLALRWYDRSTMWRAAAVGVVAGLVIDLRLTDIVLLAALPLLGVGSRAALRDRVRLFSERWTHLLAVLACMVVVFIPQSITWYIATGHWLVNSYSGESFDFLHPRLIESLFWFNPHGLLPYAPVLVLAFIGLGVAWARRRDIALPVTVAFVPLWYTIASWYDWSYAASFGHRGFIDILPLLALPMAYLLSLMRTRVLRLAAICGVGILTAVTCALMLAYWQYKISGGGIDAGGYFALLRHPHRLFGPPDFPSWFTPLVQHGRR
jgi:hypothetical protein